MIIHNIHHSVHPAYHLSLTKMRPEDSPSLASILRLKFRANPLIGFLARLDSTIDPSPPSTGPVRVGKDDGSHGLAQHGQALLGFLGAEHGPHALGVLVIRPILPDLREMSALCLQNKGLGALGGVPTMRFNLSSGLILISASTVCSGFSWGNSSL